LAAPEKICNGLWKVGCGSWGGFNEIVSAEGAGNVLLIGGEEEFALIDGGTTPGIDAVLDNCAQAGAAPQMIKRIIITHSHMDHIEGVPGLAEKTGAVIAASPLAAKGISGDEETMEKLFLARRKDFTPFEVKEILDEGDEITVGPYTFSVMIIPGHMPDSLCLVSEIEGNKVLLSGDTVIGDQGEFKGVVGYLDGHWGSNPKHMLKSIARLKDLNADIMVGGHGHPVAGRGVVQESLENCRKRVEQLLAIPGLGNMMPLDLKE
jgi:glyoxylase-like metal-dependent hydrolase (beta-lactamase superfamily II)